MLKTKITDKRISIMDKLNAVEIITPEEAHSLCRFCMKPESPHQPHYTLEWSKWPNAEITKLFEQVIGQQVNNNFDYLRA